MMIRRLMLVLGMAVSVGCVVDSTRAAYEGCNGGQSCGGGTVCTTVSFSDTGRTAFLCSTGCTVASSCPDVGLNSAYPPTCVLTSPGVGDCYDTCASNADCGIDTTCGVLPGTSAQVCVPVSY